MGSFRARGSVWEAQRYASSGPPAMTSEVMDVRPVPRYRTAMPAPLRQSPSPPPPPPGGTVGALLRDWRKVRRLSQLDLALHMEVSARHVSRVESGRAQPSRRMVTRLA